MRYAIHTTTKKYNTRTVDINEQVSYWLYYIPFLVHKHVRYNSNRELIFTIQYLLTKLF